MSHTRSAMKAFLSVLLSATLALPAPAFAKESDSQDQGAMEGVPVVLERVVINGQEATIAIAPIPASEEERLVENLAKHHPAQTVLQVVGPEDPALKAAARTGYLKYIKTFFVGTPEQTPMFTEGELPTGIKAKLRAKLKAITDFAKSDTANGLMFSMFYSGVAGGVTSFASSSVDAGLAVFSMYMLWNSIVLIKPAFWGKFLRAGGRGAVAIAEKVAGLFGVEMSERDRRIYEVVGKFAISWAVTTLQGAYVKQWSGDFEGLQGWQGFAEGFAESGMSGVQNNYNIWDAYVMKLADEGKMTEKQVKWYFRGQMVFGAVLESLAFRQVPYVGLFLGTLTGAGAVYLALHPEKQDVFASRAQKVTVAFRSGVAYIRNPEMGRRNFLRRLAGVSAKAKESCAEALSIKKVPPGFHPYAYEDIQ